MDILKVILLAVALVSIGMLGMAIRILLFKGGKFSSQHVGGSKYLKRQGIFCANTQDKIAQAQVKKRQEFKNLSIINDTKAGE